VRSGEAGSECHTCRYDSERGAPSDADRRFWLERMSDEEIVSFARFAFGRGDAEAVAAWRERLARP
jgi:hypothetical protein